MMNQPNNADKSNAISCECEDCGKEFPSKVKLKEHRKHKKISMPCLECGEPCPIPKTGLGKLFCNAACKDRAKTIRYIRSVKDRGIEHQPDIKMAINEKILAAFRGGYIALHRKIRDEVLLRDNYTCLHCKIDYSDTDPSIASMFFDVDHINGPKHELDNLQTLCKECHLVKTLQNRRPVDPVRDEKFIEFSDQIYADALISTEPHHSPNYDWRKVAAKRYRTDCNGRP